MSNLQTIMLIEDEPDIRAVGILALQAVGGFTVIECSSGGEALEKLSTQTPDLILLDVMMPEMDGVETMKRMKGAGHVPTIPVIFMTAKVQPAEVQEYKDLGAADVIAKPYDPMTLAGRVREIWNNYRGA